MEQLIKSLKVPFLITIILLLAIMLIQSTQAYNNYWQGKLAEDEYKRKNGLK